jgi:hypothetical protein
MNVPHYEIFVRNNNFEITSVIKNFSNLEFTTKFNDAGAFTIEMPNNDSEPVRKMKSVYGKYGGVIITRNGQTVFSGSIKAIEQTGDFIGGNSDQQKVVFSGIDDTALLASRICMVPTNTDPRVFSAPSNQGWGYHIYPESPPPPAPEVRYRASTVMYTIVADNIGFRAPYENNGYQDREIRQLWVQPPEVMGASYTARLRYQNLLETCQRIANYIPEEGSTYMRNHPDYRGLGFRVRQLDSPIVTNSVTNQRMNIDPTVRPLPANAVVRRIAFEVFRPRNRVDRVVFSEGFNNIGSYRYRVTAPESNYCVLGGMNDNSSNPLSRWFAYSGVGTSINKFGLWESFLDRRDLQYSDPNPVRPNPFPPLPNQVLTNAQQQYMRMYRAMVQGLTEGLQEKRDTLEFEVSVLNVEPTRYPEDIQLGDIVTVIPPSEPETRLGAQVREITVKLTKDQGETVEVKLGTENVGTGIKIYDRLTRNAKNTRHLNTSF